MQSLIGLTFISAGTEIVYLVNYDGHVPVLALETEGMPAKTRQCGSEGRGFESRSTQDFISLKTPVKV